MHVYIFMYKSSKVHRHTCDDILSKYGLIADLNMDPCVQESYGNLNDTYQSTNERKS
jgi:hypothetical protein